MKLLYRVQLVYPVNVYAKNISANKTKLSLEAFTRYLLLGKDNSAKGK